MEPPENQIEHLVELYRLGQLEKVLSEAKDLLVEFPNSVSLHNISGVANLVLGKLESAIEDYTKRFL